MQKPEFQYRRALRTKPGSQYFLSPERETLRASEISALTTQIFAPARSAPHVATKFSRIFKPSFADFSG